MERVAIGLFVVLVLMLLLVNPSAGAKPPAQTGLSPVDAYASAMPNQGWAPMTVYFSAFGSRSRAGSIVRYEWDLDGNGLYETDATRDAGYSSHYYAKPGRYLVSLQVTDGQGFTDTDTIMVTVRHPASSSVDYWTVFNDSQVRRVELTLSRADWEIMWSDPPAKLQVRADATVFGDRLTDVGFRMRGQFSLKESGEKKPWKIDTDAFVDGQEFHNLRQLIFSNNIGDPSMLQEKLAYDLMHFAGVPASHTCFVELWIDITDDDQPPIFWGVYTLVERVDRKFLGNRFGQDNRGGNLYKANHALRGPMDLIYHGSIIEAYPRQDGLYAYGKATNEEEADYSDILNLIYVVDGAQYNTPDQFADALNQVFDVDSFLRYWAVIVALGNWDSYPYTGNNYHLFNDPETGKFVWIPWDLTWGGDPRHPLFELDGPRLLTRAPLYDNVFQVEEYRTRYTAYLDLLVRFWFNSNNVPALAARYHDLIAQYVSQGTGDKMYYGESAMFPIAAFDDSWMALGDFARERSAFILEAIAGE